jgi:2-C-methyl-D-erythritol 4-phosphate cytidylyltransferase
VRYRAGSCPGRHLACRADAVRRVLDRHPRVEAVLVVPTVGGGDWRALLSRVTARIGDEVVAAVVEEVVVVSVVPMTDALKEVDARELIVASVDRSTIGVTVGPALLGRGVLRALAESAGPDATVELVDTAAHGRALTVW